MARPERFELPTNWFEAQICKLVDIVSTLIYSRIRREIQPFFNKNVKPCYLVVTPISTVKRICREQGVSSEEFNKDVVK